MQTERTLRINEYKNLFSNLLSDVYCEQLFESIVNANRFFCINDCNTLKNPLLDIKNDVKHVYFINSDDLDRIQILNNLKNIDGMNLFSIFNSIKNSCCESVEMTELLIFKVEKHLNYGYKYTLPSLTESYKNMNIRFAFNESFRFKVCKFENDNWFYVIIFFDISNYDHFIFSDHHDIVDLNLTSLDENEIDLK